MVNKTTIGLAYINANSVVERVIVINPYDAENDDSGGIICDLEVSPNYTYDTVKKMFHPPQRYASWTKSEDTDDNGVGYWNPPTPMPEPDSDGDTTQWTWDEDTTSWVAV